MSDTFSPDQLLETLPLTPDEISFVHSLQVTKYPNENEISFNDKHEVIAASLPQAILYFFEPNLLKKETFDKFFLANFFFSSIKVLFGACFARFFTRLDEEGCNIESKIELDKIRAHIIEFLKNILDNHNHLINSDGIRKAMDDFNNILESNPDYSQYYDLLNNSYQTFHSTSGRSRMVLVRAPTMILPMDSPLKWTLTSIPPVELARQITTYESKIFRQITPLDISEPHFGKHIFKLSGHFSSLSNFVTLSVLMPVSAKDRGQTTNHWISVAQTLKKINNYHGLFAVMFGLTHPAIKRMKKTIEAAQKKDKELFQVFSQLTDFCDISSDFQNYRDELAKSPPTSIPFIECLKKDISKIFELPDATPEGLINLSKFFAYSEILIRISRFQSPNTPCPFSGHERIQEMIEALPKPTDISTLLKMSIAKEKKRG